MGAWGPGIFANDTAADVRAEWRRRCRRAPTRRPRAPALTEGRDDDGADDPTATEFWTGLAAAQHETGHLQPGVRDRALALIEAGGDAELYEEGAPARLRTLRRLADKLTGPQPKPKKLRGPRPGPDPGVEVGDVVRIWSSDRSAPVLYAATRMHEHERKRRPELLGCTGRAARCPRGTSSSAFPTCPGSTSARWVRRPAVRPLRLGRAV